VFSRSQGRKKKKSVSHIERSDGVNETVQREGMAFPALAVPSAKKERFQFWGKTRYVGGRRHARREESKESN